MGGHVGRASLVKRFGKVAAAAREPQHVGWRSPHKRDRLTAPPRRTAIIFPRSKR